MQSFYPQLWPEHRFQQGTYRPRDSLDKSHLCQHHGCSRSYYHKHHLRRHMISAHHIVRDVEATPPSTDGWWPIVAYWLLTVCSGQVLCGTLVVRLELHGGVITKSVVNGLFLLQTMKGMYIKYSEVVCGHQFIKQRVWYTREIMRLSVNEGILCQM